MNFSKEFVIVLFLLKALWSESKPLPDFSTNMLPSRPDYSNPDNWSALPFRQDAADLIPKDEVWINDTIKQVDVFYIYPTIYTKGNTWNADVNDRHLNKKIDGLPVKYQASIFNQVGRVYVPRYRQAILESYNDTTGNGKQAFDLAYQDIKEAFEYYLKYYNQGRPIIIASHSQGSTHGKRLIRDFFDTSEKKQQLVAAYIVGMDVYKEDYQVLMPCKEEKAVNCYITWASYKAGSTGKGKLDVQLHGNVCVNPISWRLDSVPASSTGGILLNVNRKKRFHTEAYIQNNFLHVTTNTIFFKRKDELHLIDMNLFWYDIRANVQKRVEAYLKQQ